MTEWAVRRGLRRRIMVAASLTLAVSMATAMMLSFEEVLENERVALDRSLRRQRTHVEADLRSLLAEQSDADASDRLTAVRLAAGEFLDREPVNSTFVTMIVTGDVRQVGPSADERLRTVAEEGALDDLPVGDLRTAHTTAGDARVAVASLLDDGAELGRVIMATSLDPARNEAFAAIRRLALAGAVSVALGLVIMYVISRRLLQPLQRLRNAAASADAMRPSQRVEVTGDDEVAEVAREFNALLDRLDDASAERERLFATISHELRTPLAVAQGNVELASRSMAPHDPNRQAMATAHRELLRAGRMVADLLALGRSARSDFLQVRPTSLADLAAEIELRVDSLGMETVTVAPPPPLFVTLDADRLLQAIMNLVSNAIEHNPPGTTADVEFTVTDEVLVITVTDDGRGIPVEERQRVLEPFVRLSTARDGTHSSGLGLSVAHAVVVSHGGALRFGECATGTRVEMVLPR